MPKKIQNTTKAHLVSVPLPNHAATYTVISHQFVIDYAYQALAAAGFGIVDEEYRCTADGQIAQGIYKLNFNNDPELSMMFAWTNSYNKQVKFKCVVGAYINQTGSVMISGEVGSWVRKHTGTADKETQDTIDSYIANAYMYYTQLCSDKVVMETVTLNRRKQSQLLGVLFAEYEILTTEQASMIRDQMKKPVHVFTSSDSLWAFYNYVTNALQLSHPKTWMEDQRILHYFISTIGNFQQCSVPAQVIQPINNVSVPVVDPLASNYGEPENQTNLLVQIAEVTGDESVLEPGIHPAEQEIKDCIDEIITQYPVTEDQAFQNIKEVTEQALKDEIIFGVSGVAVSAEGVRNVPIEEVLEKMQETDNQVVQQDPEMLEIVHQVEEILETIDEAEEVPFDIDADDDAVLDSLLTPIAPCVAHDAETEREIEKENSTDIFPQDETVVYTDPVGNTFEAPVVIDTIDINENTKMAVVVIDNSNNSFDDDFDLDFNDTESEVDNTPDFF